jgi:hypothetical protein
MKLLTIILILSCHIGLAQKTLIIKPTIKSLDNIETILLYQRISTGLHKYMDNYKANSFIYSNLSVDSFLIEINNHALYSITGLSKINTDTIYIDEINFYPYISKITRTETVEKKKLFSKKFKVKKKHKIFNDSEMLEKLPSTTSFTINNTLITANLVTIPLTSIETACNPGKISYTIEEAEIKVEYKCVIQ